VALDAAAPDAAAIDDVIWECAGQIGGGLANATIVELI
jgi:hypothetical protein